MPHACCRITGLVAAIALATACKGSETGTRPDPDPTVGKDAAATDEAGPALPQAPMSPVTRACATPAPNPPATTLSPELPRDVCIPPGFTGSPIDFFDDFSWRAFVAVVWPAQAGQRGVPDAARVPGAPGTAATFETYKADWELFQPDGREPAPWPDLAGKHPCGDVALAPHDLVLGSFVKFGNLGQADFGHLVGPLVAQNNTYTRYLAAFNEVVYSAIVTKKVYLRDELVRVQQAGGLAFAPDAAGNNPINVKSAWIDMTNIPHPERYYTRTAWVVDPETDGCDRKPVGLVGLHIVTKTPSRPQWIWATFEHVDNLPGPGAVAPFTFHDGSAAAMPAENPIPYPPPGRPPTIYNVTRTTPIAPSTEATNARYQAELARQGSGVWQHYKLVMTQWPLRENAPQMNGRPQNTFPGSGATTAFTNATMETFSQTDINRGCMACHNVVKLKGDFQWAVQLNAFPPLADGPVPVPAAPAAMGGPAPHGVLATPRPRSAELDELKNILQGKPPR